MSTEGFPVFIPVVIRFILSDVIVAILEAPLRRAFVMHTGLLGSGMLGGLFALSTVSIPEFFRSGHVPGSDTPWVAILDTLTVIIPASPGDHKRVDPLEGSTDPLPGFLTFS